MLHVFLERNFEKKWKNFTQKKQMDLCKVENSEEKILWVTVRNIVHIPISASLRCEESAADVLHKKAQSV
jgi:hypothetical protein